MKGNDLKNRVRFSTTLNKDVYENLREYAKTTMIPISKLMDVAISMLIENGINGVKEKD